MRKQRFVASLGLCILTTLALAGSLRSGLSGASADSGGAPKLVEVGDALSGLPDNAAWQGVANDGTYWYLLTSVSERAPFPQFENVIRKYRISDGVLVAERRHAYPTGYPGGAAFSSGEVIDGRLHVAARGADGSHMTDVAKVLIYDTDTLDLDGEMDISYNGYAVPEGVAHKYEHYWVVFGGRGTQPGNAGKCAIVKYDKAWNPVKAYELFLLPPGEDFGWQDIMWLDDEHVVGTMHEGLGTPQTFDKYRYDAVSDSFVEVFRYPALDDDAAHKIGQGFTRLDGHLYFAARYSDRLVKAEMVDPALPTPAPTATPKAPDDDTDGDTIPNDLDPDDDNDGCSDLAERGPKVFLGGLRDPHNPWDVFDVPAAPLLARDGHVTSTDIFAVIARFGAADDVPGDFDRSSDWLSQPNQAVLPTGNRANYHPAYDRGMPVGPHAWNLGPPDGGIGSLDIFGVIAQFGLSCA